MFKQVKSIIIWSLIYKFRKRLTLVVILLSMVLLSQWIYSDIVEYLTLIEKTEYLNYILPAKWLLIFTNIGVSAFLVLTIFRKDEKEIEKPKKSFKQKDEKEENIVEEKIEKKEKFSDREKEFLNKKIRSEADILMDR